MRKFLGCVSIAAFAIVPTAIRACAEPPPIEPVVVSSEPSVATNCDRFCQPQSSK